MGLNSKRRMTKKKVKCEVCQKTFSSVQSFKIHSRAHAKTSIKSKANSKKLSPVKIIASKATATKSSAKTITKKSSAKTAATKSSVKTLATKSSVKTLAVKSSVKTLVAKSSVKTVATKSSVKTIAAKSSAKAATTKTAATKQKKNPFQCRRCCKDFPSKYSLGMHQKLQCHSRLLRCSVCPKTFVYQNALDNHLTKKHNISKSMNATYFKCSICPEKFTTKHELQEHVKTHAGQPNVNNKLVLNLHINLGELADIIERLFKCDVCGDMFSSDELLQCHLQEHHGDMSSPQTNPSQKSSELFGCRLCSSKFTSRNALNSHIKLHQAKELHVCNVCSEVFHDEDSLNVHSETHESEMLFDEFTELENSTSTKPTSKTNVQQKLYPCTICTVIFPTEEALEAHSVKHEAGNITIVESVESDPDDPVEEKQVHLSFRCDYCEKLFETSRALGLHMLSHPGANRLHQCERCPKKFASKNDYEAHKMIHVVRNSPVTTKNSQSAQKKNVRSIPCDLCKEVLPSEASLKEHKAKSHEEKPYKCHICQNEFPKSRFLKCHLRMVHKE